jgi:putative NADH-flavin reductase
MKVLLLGATGRTGKHVLRELINRGHHVNCLVRDPRKVDLTHQHLFLFEGTPYDSAAIQKSILGCDAVISVLNVARTSDFPWAKLRTPPTFMSDAMKQLIPLAEKHGVRRVVICSAWGTSETKKDMPGWFRWLIDHSNVGFAYRDHERQEAVLKSSTLDWTIVRPTGLTNFKTLQRIVESYGNIPKPKMTISRRTVAHYLVSAIESKSLVHKSPVISGY